jgi:hypothetical protein
MEIIKKYTNQDFSELTDGDTSASLRELGETLAPETEPETEAQPADPTIPVWDRNSPWLYKFPGKKVRTGYTKNHGQPRNKVKARMARESRRINRRRA